MKGLETNSIRPDTKINIQVTDEERMLSFDSTVLAVIGNAVVIERIMIKDKTVGFSEQMLKLVLYIKEGQLYSWENPQIKLVRYKNEICHMIEMTEDGKPVNRRHAFRLFVGEQMMLTMDQKNRGEPLKVLIKDISEGGVAFLSRREFNIGDRFVLHLRTEEISLNLSARIVRIERKEEINAMLYGCAFRNVTPALGNYIMRLQRENLKKRQTENRVVSR